MEHRVQIQVQAPGPGQPATFYRTGDYWLIPARTATGNVEWPVETDATGNAVPVAKPPDGVTHHDAPLAVITVTNGTVNANPTSCQMQFTALAGPVPTR